MEQMFKRTDTFLTHTWRQDLHNRDNHQRVAQVNEQLNKRGFVTWFDSKRMEGRIRDKMSEGVDFASSVLVFVTEAYMKKLDSGDKNDNCLFEYNRTLMKKEKSILCVIMEEKYDNPGAWFGRLKDDLGGNLFVSMSGDLNNKLYMKQKMDELVEQLKLKDVTPSQIRKECPSCKIYDEKTNTQIPLHGKGSYCTICKSALVQAPEARYYCGKCNLHRHGRYCSDCEQDLINPQIKITEIEDQYLTEVKLKTRLDRCQFPPLADKCQQEIEIVRNKLKKLQEKRSNVHSAGTKLFMDDKDFARKAEALEEGLASLKQTSSDLPSSAINCYELENSYNNEIQQLQEKMKHLAETRDEISQQTNDLSHGFNVCVETLDLISEQIKELKSYGVLEETDDLPNQFHDKKKCECELCTFENELTVQMKLDGGKDFLHTLITDNKVQDIRIAIKLHNEILHLTDDNRLNLLMSLILQNGTVEMLVALVGIGLQIETDELIKHFKLAYGQTFIQRLVFHNKIDELRQVITLYKDILLFKNNDELNLLTSLSFEHGTVHTLAVLMEVGLLMDADELKKQVKLGSAQIFIKKLIAAKMIDDLKTMVSLCKDVLLLTTDEGLNLLTTLTFQCGSFEPLTALVDSGLRIDVDDLMKQIRHGSGEHYIQKLIVDNKTNELLTLISLCRETLLLTDENGLNLLTTLTLQEGTFEMLGNLMEAGLQIDDIELMLQMKSDTGKRFIKKLIVDDDREVIKQMATTWKDIVHLTNDKESNLLIDLTFEHGTVSMLVTLLEIGFATNVIVKQFQLEYGQSFLKKLIVGNNIDDLKKLLSVCKDILSLTNREGANLLIYLTLSHGTVSMLATLLEIGFDTDETVKQFQLEYGQTFIEDLIVANNIDDLEKLLSACKDILSLKNREGANLLIYLALSHGSVNMLATLLEIGFDTEETVKQFQLEYGQTFIENLIVANNKDDLRKLLSACKGILTLKNEVGINLLFSLILEHGKVDMLIMLVDTFFQEQADELMQKQMRLGYVQKFIHRLITSDQIDNVKLLVSTWKDVVETITENGFNTLLYITVQQGTLGMFNMLVEAGVNVDVTPNVHNETYLHYTNNAEIAHILCQKHGDSLIPIKDAIGCTSFMKSFIKNNIPLLNVMKPYVKLPEDEIKACESYKQVIQVYKKEGIEHIKQLIKKNDLRTMRTLLMLTPEIVHTMDDQKYTPFLYCCRYGTLDMLKMMLDFGSDVLHREKGGSSTLMLAVQYNHTHGEPIINYLCCHFPELMTAEIDKQKFICKLITNNEIDNLKILLLACKGFLHLENDDGVNMLISYTLEYGKVDMLIMLLDTFFKGQADQLMKEQVREGYMQKFIRRIITSDQIDEVRLLVSTWKELVQTITENGFNVLLYHTVQHGTLGMFNMLVEAGVTVDITGNVHNETYLHYTSNIEIAQILCEKHGDSLLAVKDDIGCTSFMKSYMKNNIPLLNVMKPYVKSPDDEIKACESYKQVIQVYKKEGIEHIMQLIKKNDLLTMRTLLMFTLEMVDTEDDEKSTPFLYCSSDGTLDMLKMLLEFGSNVLHRKKGGWSALHLAVDNNIHGELIINHLCSNFPELLTAENDGKYTPFLYCSEHGTLDMLKMLLEFGSDVLHRKKGGWSALHLAVWFNNTHGELIVNYLCSNFPELMTAENDGKYTPFLYCSEHGTLDMLKMLLEFGSDVLHRNSYGNSALHLAVDNNTHGELIINYLCSNFPELMTAENDGKYTPFLYCSRYGTLDMLKMLLEFGSDVLHREKNGWSALHLAVWDNDTHGELIINYLCSHFPELMTEEDDDGWNVFHFAGQNNRENFVRILLQHTPPTTVLLKKNINGRTPIDYANNCGYKTIVQMFNDYLSEHTSSTET